MPGGGWGRYRPIAVVRVHLRMLRCGPSNRTFVHFAAFLLAETSVCGRCGLLRMRLMLTQKSLAIAAARICRCSTFH
jgi:hypothetical protein